MFPTPPSGAVRVTCALLLFLAVAVKSFAGGGPTGVIVIYDPNDERSLAIANVYQQARGIPDQNMIPYAFPLASGSALPTFSRTTAWDFVYSVRATLAARGIASQLQSIALAGIMPMDPEQTDDSQANVFSIQSFLYLSPNYSQADFPVEVYRGGIENGAYPNDSDFFGPSQAGTKALSGTTVYNGLQSWPVTFIGYPGWTGNSPHEILGFIRRAVTADGTKPSGTIYWQINQDIRSQTRESEIGEVTPVWKARGIQYDVFGNSGSGVWWVSDKPDIIGGVIGAVTFDTIAGNTYLPGSWVDDLTSYGGNLDTLKKFQMSASDMMRAGAYGSAGTISEPLADPTKFPHAHIYTHFRAGASLAEAFWQSIQNPAEIIALGDPLMQPFADIPVVHITAPANKATVSGALAISATASPVNGQTLEPNRDLFIDGRLIGIGSATEPVLATRTAGGFNLTTTTLADGWHDVRVVAYNSDAVRTQGQAEVGIFVSNAGQSIALSGPATVNPDTTASFTATPAGLSDLTSIALQSNGRTLATLPASGGTAILSGSLVPLDGSWTVYALGTRSNGQQISSAPFTSTINWVALSATASPPLGSAAADVRLFYNTVASGFNWDTSTPDVVTTCSGDPVNGLCISSTNCANVSFTNGSIDISKHPGFDCHLWFYAPVDDWYEFAYLFANSGRQTGFTLAVDGQSVPLSNYGGSSATAWKAYAANFSYQPKHLAPGWHAIRAQSIWTGNDWTHWTIRVRGGISQDFSLITLADVASSGSNTVSTTPEITSITPSASPVTGKTVSLTANATVGDNSALTYYWTAVSGPPTTNWYENTDVLDYSPGPGVTFTPNGTTAAATTTGSFQNAGNYVLNVRVAGAAGATETTLPLTVQQTASGVVFQAQGPAHPSVIRGDSLDIKAFTEDQFGKWMAIAPINPSLPTMTWTTTDPAGTIKLTSSNGELAQYSSLSGTGTTQTFKITATGTNGRTGSNSFQVDVLPSSATTAGPYLQLFTITQSGAGQPVQFAADTMDPNDPYWRYLTFQWSLVSAPPGQTLPFDNTLYPTTFGFPSASGTYTVALAVTDQTGATLTGTQSFIYSGSDQATGQPEFGALTPDTAQVGEVAVFSPAAVSGDAGVSTDPSITWQWQSSSTGGATWQNIAGATSYTLEYGPVLASDSGTLFRVLATNAAGTITSNAVALTSVTNPSGGVIGIAGYDPSSQTTYVLETSGSVSFTVHRYGQTSGAASVQYAFSDDGATLGVDYGTPGATTAITGKLTWASGDSSDRVLTVPIINDAQPTGDEIFLLTLSNNTGASLAYNFGSSGELLDFIDIENGPGEATFASPSATVNQSGGSVILTVQRAGACPSGTLSVSYSAPADAADASSLQATENAVPGTDYTAVSGTLTWNNGDTSTRQIAVPITNTGSFKGDKAFAVGLSSPNYNLLGNYQACLVTILPSPFQQWQAAYWPGAVPAEAAYSSFLVAEDYDAPLFTYRFSETSGSNASAVNASNAVVTTGTLSTVGTGSYAWGTPGPRPPEWPGLEGTNTALTLVATGSTGTPTAFSGGAALNSGTAAGMGSAIANGITICAFVKTSVNDHVMCLMGGCCVTDSTSLIITLNESQTAPTTVTADNLRVRLVSGAGGSMDYSVPLTGLPTGRLTDGQWHQIAITIPAITNSGEQNADYPSFFFDGELANPLDVRGLDNIETQAVVFSDFTNGLRIGANGTGPANTSVNTWFSGLIDEVTVFPEILTPAQIANIATAAPAVPLPAYTRASATPQNDGIPNLLKYALGLNPLSRFSGGETGFSVMGGHLALSFNRMGYATDITYHVRASIDLKNWSDVWSSATHPYTGGSAASVLLNVPDTVTIGDPNYPRRFLELEVTQP